MSALDTDAAEVIRVIGILDAAGVSSGIAGGWGIDALNRRQTRTHRDLDLGVAAESIDSAVRALEPLGYAIALDLRPARLVLEGPHGQVDLHPIIWDANGHGVQRGLGEDVFEYPPGSLGADGEIAGHRVRCATPDVQIKFHQGYEPSARDRRDMAELAAFGIELPPPYTD